jgi:hypothetical protein
MKYVLIVMMAAGWFCIAMAAFAQSTAPQATPSPAASSPAAPNPAPLSPAPSAATTGTPGAAAGGKRAGCLTGVQDKKGQDRQDQMQLCMAQARVECLKQAIDQKVANAQRKDFMKTCMQEE